MRHPSTRGMPPRGLGAPYTRRRRPFSRSLHCYLLFRQFCPVIFMLVGVGAFVYFYNLDSIMSSDIAKQAYKASASGLSKLSSKAKPKTPQKSSDLPTKTEVNPLYSFVLFGSYRSAARSFAAIGLAGRALRESRKLGVCEWRNSTGGGRIQGKLSSLYPLEHHDLSYETLVIRCELSESTEPGAGGELTMDIDGTNVPVYSEKSSRTMSTNPLPPYEHQVTYCSPPLFEPVRVRQLYEWIEYSIYQGVDHFIFYDMGAVNPDVLAMLKPYLDTGLVEVVAGRESTQYESWQHGHVLVMNDCAYRTRFTSRWTLFTDVLEYYSSYKGQLLREMLESHMGQPYVTFGSRWWSIEKCIPDSSGGDWSVERMVYHWPDIYCQDKEQYPRVEMCLDYHGFRKYAVDPRMVHALAIHRTVVPSGGGMDVDADVALFNRFHQLLDRRSSLCSRVVQAEETIDWWVRDQGVAKFAAVAKRSPKAKYKGKN